MTTTLSCKLPKVLNEETWGARRLFLWVDRLSSWADFNEHPEGDPSGGVLKGQSGGSKWVLGPWRFAGAFPGMKGREEMKERESKREEISRLRLRY